MKIEERHSVFQFKAPYYTLNELTAETKTIWLVCHGYGQLSRYFLRRFNLLDPQENFLIFPQGLSKFYLDLKHDRVGATWMTKEDRLTDIDNQYAYLDHVMSDAVGADWADKPINYFGFSQGVSTISRYAAYKKKPFSKMILWGGGIPPELNKEDFSFMKDSSSVELFLGDKDEFYTEEVYLPQVNKAKDIMGPNVSFTIFDGGHQISPKLIASL